MLPLLAGLCLALITSLFVAVGPAGAAPVIDAALLTAPYRCGLPRSRPRRLRAAR